MNITKTQNENEVTLKLEGHLNTLTAPALEVEIGKLLDIGTCSIMLDMQELAYLSSAGIRVILATAKKVKAPRTLILKNVCEGVMEVFEITGLSAVLDIV